MSICAGELTMEQLLADPLVLAVMKADGVDPDGVRAMLKRTRRDVSSSDVTVDPFAIDDRFQPPPSLIWDRHLM